MKKNLKYDSVFIIAPENSNYKADFFGLKNALDFIQSKGHLTTVHDTVKILLKLKKGIYRGQFCFDCNNCVLNTSGLSEDKCRIILHIAGAGMKKTIITGGLYAALKTGISFKGSGSSDSTKLGTFRSFTFFLSGAEVVLENLTIENTAGLPPPLGVGLAAGQAIALYSDSSVMKCRHVRLSGFQDTLFMSPLPAFEREKNGFAGLRMNTPRLATKQFFYKCEISGTVDFIFGGASAFFKNCKIIVLSEQKQTDFSSDKKTPRDCYIAAPCDDMPCSVLEKDCLQKNQHGVHCAPNKNVHCMESGFVFYHCDFQIEKNAMDNRLVFLARPWRPFGRSAFIDCRIDKRIGLYDLGKRELFHNWDKPEDLQTACFLANPSGRIRKEFLKRFKNLGFSLEF